MSVITVPRPLRDKLGEDASDSLVTLLNQASDSTRDNVIAVVEEKFERRLAEELAKVRVEMAALRVELRDEIAKLRVEMAESKSEMIRWMFLFWIGQVVAIVGILLAFFRR